MQEYFDEGIEHFYFMALGRDEFIDATKKGNLGRFLNHSCRPNCKVEKWVVGKKSRMGIFTKRKIAAGEELTFNYNVDRYGCVELDWPYSRTQTRRARVLLRRARVQRLHRRQHADRRQRHG